MIRKHAVRSLTTKIEQMNFGRQVLEEYTVAMLRKASAVSIEILEMPLKIVL